MPDPTPEIPQTPTSAPSSLPSPLPRPWWRPDPLALQAAFDHQRRIDPFGHLVHTWLAALACLCLGATTSAAELGAVPVMAAFLIRFHRHWRTLPHYLLQPLILVVLAWGALGAASILWTAGQPEDWLEELGVLRFLLVALAIWPVSDRRPLLLGALAAGFAVGQSTQVLHALGRALEIDAITWNRFPGRNSGWWDPVVGGTLLCAVLGLHLPAALWGRAKWRVLGALGSAAAAVGILATGSRGAWLAGTALVAIAVAAWVWRGRGKVLRPALALGVIAAILAAVAWASLGQHLTARYQAGRAEVARAFEARDFDSDTGARILMAWWAVEAMQDRPLTGVGLGGYRPWTRAHVAAQQIDPATRRFHAHAHNALLHAGATLGIPGLALAIAFVLLAVRGSARRQPGDGPTGYARGPCFALLGLLMVSPFDVVHVNSQTAALLAVLTVFAVGVRPHAGSDPAPDTLAP